MDKRSELLSLLQNDPFNLLESKGVRQSSSEQELILRNNFEEIVDFFEENGREPNSNLNNITEYQLFCRLKTIRSNPNMVKVLKPFDLNNLLKDCRELSLEEVISQDPFGLLDEDVDPSIFTLRNVKSSSRINPDYIARRKRVPDFNIYKPLFDNLHEELENGKRKLAKYKSDDLKEGGFYVLNGILLFLKSVEGEVNTYAFESGDRTRFDGRTICIFDNGTYSDMLFRSLDKALLKDGYGVSDLINESHIDTEVTTEDKSYGYIYVLRSRHPKFKGIDNIFKIGCTRTSVSERIKNARNQPTYLYADVDIIATYRCYNVDVFSVEQAIHTFLDSVRLDIDIPDYEGNLQKPKEWFSVSFDIIEETIALLQTDTINDYLYDKRSNRIVKK
jgi:hypothetical protein